MQMETLAHIQVTTSSAVPVHKIKTIGNLDLNQADALFPAGTDIFTLYNDNFFNRLESISSRTLMLEYAQRNVSTKYNLNGPPIVQYRPSDTVNIEIIIKVPQMQEIKYICGFWQVIKFAWIQYLLVLIFWYYVLYRGFLGYLVQANVFDNVEVTNINTRNLR